MSADNLDGPAGGPDRTSNEQKETVPLDPGDSWWAATKNRTNALFQRLSPEDEAQWYKDEEMRRWPEMLKNCQDRRKELMKYSPIIRFMREKVGQMGGKITNESFPCNFCDGMAAAGFNQLLGMQLCANRLPSIKHQEDAMAHELIHAYDHLRFNVDWDNLRHAACTEIRASSLSGECRFTREFWHNSQYKLNKGYQDCVRRRATLSLIGRGSCKDKDDATKIVDSVFDSCMTDTRPFDEVYR